MAIAYRSREATDTLRGERDGCFDAAGELDKGYSAVHTVALAVALLFSFSSLTPLPVFTLAA